MNWQHLRVLLRYDLKFALRQPRGVLFLAFLGIFWAFFFIKIAGSWAQNLCKPEASLVLGWFLDARIVRMFCDHPPNLAAYFLVAMTATPWFVMMGACDQTANDVGSKHLRFLIPRCGRLEIYFARSVGALVLVGAAQLLVSLIAVGISLGIDQGGAGPTVGFALRVVPTVLAYSAPFVGLMALVSALSASAGVSAIIGMAGYSVILGMSYFLKLRWEGFAIVKYLVPSGLKDTLMQGDAGATLAACLGLVVYLALYWALGWFRFRSRDA